jgi:ligand-binding sensor domain-containing protein
MGIKFTFAQNAKSPFIFDNFADEHGTSSNIINCFLKDVDGFLWIGTGDGLKRFDGNKFEIFKHEKGNPNSLVHSEVLALCEDKKGRIWTGTQEGVGYFDKKTNQFFNLKPVNKTDYVCFNMVCDTNGDIWFSIRDKGIFSYSEKTQKLQNFSSNALDNSSITSNRIIRKGMVLDPFKRGIWLATTKGANFFEFSSQKFYHKNNNPKSLPILDVEDVGTIALDEKQLIYFDFNANNIKYFDLTKDKISKEIFLKTDIKNERIELASISVDNQHNLWFCSWTNNGFYYNAQSDKIYDLISDSSSPTSIAAAVFWDIFQQEDGDIWLGTTNGISITNPQNNLYEIYDLSELYPPLKKQNQLYAFAEDAQDSTWWLAATQNNFVHYFPKTNLLEAFAISKTSKNSNPLIRALMVVKNNIYIATTNSFYLFNKKTKKQINIPLPDSLHSTLLNYVTQKGDSIWFFGNNSIASSYKIATKKWSFYSISAKSITGVSNIEVDNQGNLWIAIHKVGLAKFSNKKQRFELINSSNYIDFKKVGYNSMQKDKEGNLWLGTYDLIKFNPKSRSFISILDINFLQSLLIAEDGNIWVSAFNDYTIFNPRTQEIIKKTIPIEKGALSWSNQLYSLLNGQIISLIRGLVIKIDPSKLIPVSTRDKVLIGSLQLTGKVILIHKNASSLVLNASENSFAIFSSVLKPPKESGYKFYYQMKGFNEDWVLGMENYASFSNLAGGDYIFNIKGIKYGVETPISTLNIHIDTVFYKSKWFFALIALSIFGLIYSFYRYRIIQAERFLLLQLQTKQLEKDKSEIQYQNLINHLNPHFLFNSLSSLSSLIESEEKDVANIFLDNLSKIYRYILKNRESETVSLMSELKFTENYIKLQQTRFAVGFQVVITVNDENNYSKIVPVTIQNLIENAIKHNIIDEEIPLVINIYIEDDYLVVSNNFNPKKFVETSNQQGLESMKSLYKYLTNKALLIKKTEEIFSVYIPLI